jgi:NAD-dependent DNA ligase
VWRLHLATPAELWAELDQGYGPDTPPVELRDTRSSQPVAVSEWDGDFAGKSVCFTGSSGFTFRGAPVTHTMQELLAVQHGMTVRPGVSKTLDILVIGPDRLRSTKAKKAEALGTVIVDEATF